MGINMAVTAKIIYRLIALSGMAISSYGADNSNFQEFDEQVSIGYGYSSSTISNPNNSGISQTYNTSSVDLNIEKL
ncbi:MAG: hypothetical protein QG673_671, partial [Pseudomonadota bacterium]|nr:hypothetical protein [Pseudomonadota bacterium]